MPYAIRKEDDHYVVYNKDTGDVRGKTASRENAKAMIRAIYANTHEDK